MMLTEPPPRVLVVTYLLMAVRDAYDRFRLRPGPTFGPDLFGWYDMVGRVEGKEYEVIGPSGAAAQQFPIVLAGFCRHQNAWCRLRRWLRRRPVVRNPADSGSPSAGGPPASNTA